MMNTFRCVCILFAVLCAALPQRLAAETWGSPEVPVREYTLMIGTSEDLNMVASLGVNAYRALTDLYYLGLRPAVPQKLEPVIGALWQTGCSFFLTIWPHEFGHWTRAREVGGEFVFERLTFPWPKARMDLPDDVSLFSETLTSVGGFEINNLMRRQIMTDYYGKGYSFATLPIHAFIQEIYYPAYAYIVAPLVSGKWIDPEDPDTWIHTMGDPVESSLGVYKNYYDRSVPLSGEPVDPDLVSYYREARTLSLLWMLIDPGLYESARAFGVGMDENAGLVRPFMFGKGDVSWIYGTMFNASPLGYELYLDQHFRVKGNYFSISLRYGRPYDNYGLSIRMPSFYRSEVISLGAETGYWYQGPFGHGVMGEMNFSFRSKGILGATLTAGWKSGGYLLGLPIEKGAYVRGGFVFRTH